MFPHLNDLGYQKEGKSTFAGKTEQEDEEDDYPQVKCLVVDERWLRNPE